MKKSELRKMIREELLSEVSGPEKLSDDLNKKIIKFGTQLAKKAYVKKRVKAEFSGGKTNTGTVLDAEFDPFSGDEWESEYFKLVVQWDDEKYKDEVWANTVDWA